MFILSWLRVCTRRVHTRLRETQVRRNVWTLPLFFCCLAKSSEFGDNQCLFIRWHSNSLLIDKSLMISICTHSSFQRADGSQDIGGGGHGDGDKGKKPLNQVSKRADLLKLGQLTLHLVFESTLSQQTRNSL